MNKKTGGPAFPTQSRLGLNDSSTWITEIPGQPGMTLRDYFAAKAMQGLLADSSNDMHIEDMVMLAYEYADEMLKAREQ